MMVSGNHSFFRHLVIGNNQFILSHKQYKRILLTGQLCIITFVVCVGYLAFDLASGILSVWPYQLACAIMAFVSFLLNRKCRFTMAKVLLGLSVNIAVFIFASSEPLQVGQYMYFIPATLGAMVVFDPEERGKAFFFVLLSMLLFLLSLFVRTGLIVKPPYTEQYILVNIMINFIGSFWASVSILYFLISVNHRSEGTLLKAEQDMLKKNEELTRLNTELDRFVYSTAHDLRAPLNSILGLIQLTEVTQDASTLKEYINLMQGRVKDLEKFIRDISDVTRNNRLLPDFQRVPVKHLVFGILENLRYLPEASSVKVTVNIPDTLEIVTDVMRLQIILSNVISNAFKYQDAIKGNSFIHIASTEQEGVLRISIEDNGIGIPETYMDKIFNMYQRAHQQSEGSGLGLYIVKEALAKISGCIHVESTERVGTKFIIAIPAQQAVVTQPIQATS